MKIWVIENKCLEKIWVNWLAKLQICAILIHQGYVYHMLKMFEWLADPRSEPYQQSLDYKEFNQCVSVTLMARSSACSPL